MMAGRTCDRGSTRLSSQLVTVSVVTSSSLATSFWNRPSSSRFCLRWSPRVFRVTG